MNISLLQNQEKSNSTLKEDRKRIVSPSEPTIENMLEVCKGNIINENKIDNGQWIKIDKKIVDQIMDMCKDWKFD